MDRTIFRRQLAHFGVLVLIGGNRAVTVLALTKRRVLRYWPKALSSTVGSGSGGKLDLKRWRDREGGAVSRCRLARETAS